MKISVDKNKCIKCGLCSSICPEVFILKEDGTEVVYKDDNFTDKDIDKKLLDDLEMAERSCPVKAITIEGKPSR